jgi:hypothetical protein
MAVGETFVAEAAETGPTATAIADQDCHEGEFFSLDVSGHFAASAIGDSLTYSASLPAGLSRDIHPGIICGVPTDGDFGINPITVTATDSHGMAISESFVLEVGDSGPTATAIASQNFNFSSLDGRFVITGQFVASQSLDAAGGYDVTGIAGSVIGPNWFDHYRSDRQSQPFSRVHESGCRLDLR